MHPSRLRLLSTAALFALLTGAQGDGCIPKESRQVCKVDGVEYALGDHLGNCGECSCTRSGEIVCLAIGCPPECFKDEDCPEHWTCEGEIVCPPEAACFAADQPGVCTPPSDDAEKTCQSTGGTWDPYSCGNYACGVPPMCDAIIPGCDCGAKANFVSGEGCVEDAECPGTCAFDEDCPKGSHCEGSSLCPPEAVCVWQGEPGTCVAGVDCRMVLCAMPICDDGYHAETAEGECCPTCVPDPTCFSDADCLDNEYCTTDTGACLSPCSHSAICLDVCAGVCQPRECSADACGPGPEAPNYLCPDGKTWAGPGPCERNADGVCGWTWVACPIPCSYFSSVPDQCPQGLSCECGTQGPVPQEDNPPLCECLSPPTCRSHEGDFLMCLASTDGRVECRCYPEGTPIPD